MYTVKKRINQKSLAALITGILVFSVLIVALRAEKIPQNNKLKILILSKHIRLLREGKTDILRLSVPKSGEIDTGSRRTGCSNLTILYKNNSFQFKADEKVLAGGDFTLYPKESGDTFMITINGEKRRYPLPLHVKNTGLETELSIEESVNRFAIDSAWGELGDTPEKHSEALYALAHLIKARSSLPYLTNKHSGYTFCDLTCCQTYRGLSGKLFDDTVSVKTGGVRNGFFFHTSSGGRLFTESIFNATGKNSEPPKEIIYQDNILLSREKFSRWGASIGENELIKILYPDKNIFIKDIEYDIDRESVLIRTGTGTEKIPPETFRLKINRVRGWNFIKSNNYTLTRINGVYKFSGSGLGHGAGMSFEGALQLAERGYSRYEILEHYYPGIEYNIPSHNSVNNQLQYVIFNSGSGEIIRSSSASFKNRIIPCGSVFKLFIALYLAEERRDIYYNHSFICTSAEKDKNLPRYCWNKTGHGKMNLHSAIYNSCNKYFASLYNKIDYTDFKKWLTAFTLKNGIELAVPEIKNETDLSNLLSGTNFRLTITISGIIKLNRYIYAANQDRTSGEIVEIFDALHKTFTEGTAVEPDKNSILKKIASKDNINKTYLWGKTGTIIAGSNSHCGYGIFTGGRGSVGIVTLLRKGTGATAARESEKILLGLE